MTIKEVFAKRRAGKIDEAFEMSLKLMNTPDPGEWDIKALGWCLIDLIKRDSKAGQQQNLERYRQQLEDLNINPADDILTQQRAYALKLCSSNGQAIQRAKDLSQEGHHLEAVRIYWKLFSDGDHSDGVQTSFGWELYRLAKQVIDQIPPNFNMAHQCLGDYFRLTVEKQPRLHSCILSVADKMAKVDKINMGEFVRVWGLENLTAEDFDQFIANDGKSYPSLAERVIQKAIKDAFGRNAVDDLKYIVPYLNTCIEKFPDNLWLKLNKAKMLIAMGRSDEALSYGFEVVKKKTNDFWSWGLLGDIYRGISDDLRMACYCKALLCSKDVNFVGNVKLKLAGMLIEREYYEKAKLEIDEVIDYRKVNNQKIPHNATMMMAQDWYSTTTACPTNRQFYLECAKVAEELLYNDLSWVHAVFGDSFTPDHKQRTKPMRKLYIESSDLPFEAVIAESKVARFKPQSGVGIKIKGEFDDNQRFQVYIIQERSGATEWDIFDEQVGVIDHVNINKKLLHFIVDRKRDGIIHFADLKEKFREGDAIAVRLSRYTSKQGRKERVVSARKTIELVPTSLLKAFKDHVRVRNCMGFTDGEVFIPPPLILEHKIDDDCIVSGMAILNYNQKRFEWGWKAIRIKNVEFLPGE